MLEYDFDVTRGVASIVVNGVMFRYPNIRFITVHSGGTVPMLSGRMKDRVPQGAEKYLPNGLYAELRKWYYDIAHASFPWPYAAMKAFKFENLARELEPIAPLWRPSRRAAAWSLGAAFYLGILVVGMGVAKSGTAGAGTVFWLSQIAAVVMGLLASRAAFASVVPGSSKRVWVWAMLAAVVWLGTLVLASPWDFDWAAVRGATHEWLCVGFIVIGGAPLMLVLAVMLRRGAPLTPGATAAFAALAAGALANVGACLSLPHANSAITFAWHGGVVLTLAFVAALTGHLVFRWHFRRSLSIVDGAARE